MKIEILDDVEAVARRAAAIIAEAARAAVAARGHFAFAVSALDLVHLGLGPDGNTASLVPGDPVLGVTDTDVALAGPYQGRRRMTLTYPAISRARRILWIVTGADKAAMLARLRDGDRAIPAGRVSQGQALVLVDEAALDRAAAR